MANQDDKTVFITREGYEQLVKELKQLKNVDRKEVTERLKEAIKLGDLSENSEYQEARTEQSFLEGRVLELEEKIKNAKIIREQKTKANDVQLGSKVTICLEGKDKKEAETYTIVGSTEADPMAYKISNESPVGSSLMGKKAGDSVTVHAPSGRMKYKLLKLE